MNCPKCNNEMEEGYLNAPSLGICWLDNPKRKLLIGKKVKKLQSDYKGFSFKKALLALRCKFCKLVVFEYD